MDLTPYVMSVEVQQRPTYRGGGANGQITLRLDGDRLYMDRGRLLLERLEETHIVTHGGVDVQFRTVEFEVNSRTDETTIIVVHGHVLGIQDNTTRYRLPPITTTPPPYRPPTVSNHDPAQILADMVAEGLTPSVLKKPEPKVQDTANMVRKRKRRFEEL